MLNAGVVHQNVDATANRNRLLHEHLRLGALRQIRWDVVHARLKRFRHLLAQTINLGRIAETVHHYFRARFGKAPRHRKTNAAGGARDESNAIFKRFHGSAYR